VGGHYKGPLFIPPKKNEEKGAFRLLDPDNVLAQLRLYKWFWKKYKELKADEERDHYSGYILKDQLMREIFHDAPSVNKVRIGKLLRMLVQYDVNFQKNPSAATGNRTLMLWRWSHPLEFAYGLEYLMELWVPAVTRANNGKCDTDQDFLEELEIMQGQSEEDDHRYIEDIMRHNIF
jgi:hypothetical protein